jgi:hypothetical protein
VRAKTATLRKSATRLSSKARATPPSRNVPVPVTDAEVRRLTLDLGRMIEAARRQVAQAANASLTSLYWQLGNHVRHNVLEGQRAEYGARLSPRWGDH